MNRKLFVSFLLLIVVISMIAMIVSAHNFYNPFKWSKKSGIYYLTKINGSQLASNSIYLDNLSQTASYWSNISTIERCQVKSFSESNVDFWTPSQSAWDEYYEFSDFYAVAHMQDTNNNVVDNYFDFNNGSIKYAYIWVNPNNIGPALESGQTLVCVHEIGHVYGLWHSDPTTDSVMYSEYIYGANGSLKPHDITDLNNKYGSP